jgi:hypothetical protein
MKLAYQSVKLNRMGATQTACPPLCKRGAGGDLTGTELAATAKSPLPPFFKGGLSCWFNLTGYYLLQQRGAEHD